MRESASVFEGKVGLGQLMPGFAELATHPLVMQLARPAKLLGDVTAYRSLRCSSVDLTTP